MTCASAWDQARQCSQFLVVDLLVEQAGALAEMTAAGAPLPEVLPVATDLHAAWTNSKATASVAVGPSEGTDHPD